MLRRLQSVEQQLVREGIGQLANNQLPGHLQGSAFAHYQHKIAESSANARTITYLRVRRSYAIIES